MSDRSAQVDPVGPENRDRFVGTLTGLCDDSVVCGWGVHGAYCGQDIVVLDWLRELGIKPVALGLTKDGPLNHPLYVPYSVEPVAVEGRRSAGSYSVIR